MGDSNAFSPVTPLQERQTLLQKGGGPAEKSISNLMGAPTTGQCSNGPEGVAFPSTDRFSSPATKLMVPKSLTLAPYTFLTRPPIRPRPPLGLPTAPRRKNVRSLSPPPRPKTRRRCGTLVGQAKLGIKRSYNPSPRSRRNLRFGPVTPSMRPDRRLPPRLRAALTGFLSAFPWGDGRKNASGHESRRPEYLSYEALRALRKLARNDPAPSRRRAGSRSRFAAPHGERRLLARNCYNRVGSFSCERGSLAPD